MFVNLTVSATFHGLYFWHFATQKYRNTHHPNFRSVLRLKEKKKERKKPTSGNNPQIHIVSQFSDRPSNPYLGIFTTLFTGQNQQNA